MSAIKKRLIDAALMGLDAIGVIFDEHTGKNGELIAQGAIAAKAIIEGLRDGFSLDITPEEVVKKIEEAQASLQPYLDAHDKVTQDALDAKFGKKTAQPSEG